MMISLPTAIPTTITITTTTTTTTATATVLAFVLPLRSILAKLASNIFFGKRTITSLLG